MSCFWLPRCIRSFIMTKKRIIAISIILCVSLYMFYYKFKRDELREYMTHSLDYSVYNDSEDPLISTPGCYIGNYPKLLHFNEAAQSPFRCYDRIVTVDKISNEEIMFRINQSKIQSEVKRYYCCYKFANRSNEPGQEDNRISYSNCNSFKNGTKTAHEEEVIFVSCEFTTNQNPKATETYDDAYLILKKKPTDYLQFPTKEDVIVVKENWNILIVGVDTMSRARAYNSLPKTTKYLKDNNWLDYRGYHKIGLNTFPNVMSILTGLNSSKIYSSCAKGMDDCKNLLIWNKFKEAGYVTAYGEDNLKLPDTFSPYKGFKFPPTDHYTRPFFLTGEYRTGNYICTKSKPSAKHLLEYAEQFAKAYKNDSFFGYFWLNSLSHNIEYLPTLFEDVLIIFFNNLHKSGVLSNTFVFFLGDHGIRYGGMRVLREAYYEERLPMLFMWVPPEFRETHPEKYSNLQLNQFRLTTPYDVHMTLWKLMKMSNRDMEITKTVECPECKGLIEEISPERNCATAHISEKWCICHNMTKTKDDAASKHSLDVAVKYIQKRASEVKTYNCTKCSPFELKTVLRSDSYTYNNKTYYVIAFTVSPGDVGYEANIEHDGKEFNLLPPTETISAYNVRGNCVVNKYDAPYCVCETDKYCKKKDYSIKKRDK